MHKLITDALSPDFDFILGYELTRTVPVDTITRIFDGCSEKVAALKDRRAELSFHWSAKAYLSKEKAEALALRPTSEEIAAAAEGIAIPDGYDDGFAEEKGRAPTEQDRQAYRMNEARTALMQTRPLCGLPSRVLEPIRDDAMSIIVFGHSPDSGDERPYRLTIDLDELLRIREAPEVLVRHLDGAKVRAVRTAPVNKDEYLWVVLYVEPTYKKNGLVLALPVELLDTIAYARYTMIVKALPLLEAARDAITALAPRAAGTAEPPKADTAADGDTIG